MMKTTAVRMYGAMDLRLETFELPPLGEDEILMRVVSDSLCTSTYKAVLQGSAHKRVPSDIGENPVIIGHEMCGEIAAVGKNIGSRWQVGQRAVIQPALKLENGHDVGYSFQYIGGSATYVVVPAVVLERGCLLPFEGDAFFQGSLVEAFGCILRGYKGFYHTDYENYKRTDGAKSGGRLAILGGTGPMGLGAVEMAVGSVGVCQIVVTDLNPERLSWAARQCSAEYAREKGVSLQYLNTGVLEDPVQTLIAASEGGFDDVFVMAPVPELFSMAEQICRVDGCINFFAGPAQHELPGSLNLYRVHYDGIHVVGTAGSIPQDTEETIALIEQKRIRPEVLVSHICGLSAVPEAIFSMKTPAGAKKVCYPELDLPMIALDELPQRGKTDPLCRELAKILEQNGGLWCAQAERYLLAHAPRMREDTGR